MNTYDKDYWHRFEVKVSPYETFDVTLMNNWCNMNCMDEYNHAPVFSKHLHVFYFKSKHDWAMFKLTWDNDATVNE